MNDLKRIFLQLKETTEGLGDVIIMANAVKGKKYPIETIRRAFNNCVSKDEYENEDKVEIVNYLFNHSQLPL